MSLLERDSVLVSTTENGDPIVDLPFTRVNNVEGIGRCANTVYSVSDVVYTDTNLSVALKCVTAGTTSNTELDISGNNIGDIVTDGSVVWQVCNRTSDVTSVNGKTGDVVVEGLPVGSIIAYAGNTTPSGFLDCNGASLNPNTYINLFDVIGVRYGGDGVESFKLPNISFVDSDSALTANLTGSIGFGDIVNVLYYQPIPPNTFVVAYDKAHSNTNFAIGEGYICKDGKAESGGQSYYVTMNANSLNVEISELPISTNIKYCIKY